MNEIDITVHQGAEGRFRLSRHELLNELPVFHNTQSLPEYPRRTPKADRKKFGRDL
jgi:hypothetical protein